MAAISITLPNGLVFVVAVPNGGQSVPITIRECAFGECQEWFPVLPAELTKIYCSETCQQHSYQDKHRKTDRRQTNRHRKAS